MKNILVPSLLALGFATVASAQTPVARNIGSLTLLGGWDFNGGSAASDNEINARYNQTYSPYYTGGIASNPGNLLFGRVSLTANGGTFATNRQLAASNAPNYDLLSTDGLAPLNNSLGDNATNSRSLLLSLTTALDNGRAVFQISSSNSFNNFENLFVDYSARNGGTDFATISWSYSLNGTDFFNIAGSADQIDPSGTAYSVFSADFSAITAIEGKSTLYLGLNYVENSAAASVFLDNVAIYGTASAIPEPSTYAALAGAAGLGFAVWRRRHKRNAA